MELVTLKVKKDIRKALQFRAVEKQTRLWKVVDEILRTKLQEDGDLVE